MKKLLSILLLLIIALIIWFCLTKQATQKSTTPEPTNAIEKLLSSQTRTNLVEVAPNAAPANAISQATNVIAPLTNALTADNLEQWKAAITGLRKSSGLSESWDMEITNRTSGIPIPLMANGQTNFYKARFINLDIYEGGEKIMEAQLHSPIMNIDETRELGLQLCSVLGQDPSDFLAWCDKVGNHWLDAPLYFSKSAHDPNSNKIFEFKTLRTYTDEKPWFIDFIIMNP
jgi:hypothetical protein